MTKADLIKALADMPDDAKIAIDTKYNILDIESIELSHRKKWIFINLNHSIEDKVKE